MNRRRFLQLAAGAGVATATMAEVGFFAEFISWVKRSPKWFIPKTAGDFLTAAKIRQAVDTLTTQTYTQGKDVHFGIIHPFAMDDIMGDDYTLSRLSLHDLATVYYDKKAIENLKRPMSFSGAVKEIEASVIRTKNGTITKLPKQGPRPTMYAIGHSEENRLSYTKNAEGQICAVLAKEGVVDLVPSTSLAYRNYNRKVGA